MDSSSDITHLIKHIASVSTSNTDGSLEPQTRQELQSLLKRLSFALESPFETLNRLVVLPFQHAVVRVAIDLRLFEYMVEAGESGRTVDDIMTKTAVDAILLREYCGDGFDFIGPVFQKLPSSLAKRDYRCPTATQGPLQDAYNTNVSGWEFILDARFSDSLQDCNKFMKGRRDGSVSWLDFYPFAEVILAKEDADAETVLVVDVGGGLGHGLVEIKNKFPGSKGRLILQDHPKTIDQAGNGVGVFEPMAHDFFTPQPVQGPKTFLIRQVLHDWPDHECKKILENLAAAMQPGFSKILINEFVLADFEASDFITAIDLVMMGMSGGMERTKNQWHSLLASVGLRIEKIWTQDEITESVIEVVLD
ncbi:MAG: hypothetical protein Q9178_003597 [Gyalolechia marmorata]